MFKNLNVFRIAPGWEPDLLRAEERLQKDRFAECGATQPASAGWIEPRGTAHGPLVESINGHWLLRLMTEQKVLPGSVVRRRADEIAAQIEHQTGRKPGRKQGKEIKEQATLELLPMAFTRRGAHAVWIDPQQRLLLIDASSPAKAEEVVTLLVNALDGFAVTLLQTQESPAGVMASWLSGELPPATFTVDRECELRSSDEMKSVVRYARHPLDTEEVRQHIVAGKRPTRLALTWAERVSFTLTDQLQLKKIEFLDVVVEGRPDAAQREEEFDTDAAIATGELSQLIPDLVEALGGEQTGLPGATADTAPKPAAAAAAPAEPATADEAPW